MSEANEQLEGSGAVSTPRQWHETFSAPPILSSEKVCWPALIRQWSDTSPAMEQSALDHHFVTLHLGGPKRISRRGEGPTILTDVDCDGLSIMPAGSNFSWYTEGPVGFAHLYLTPRMVDRVVLEEFDRDPRGVSLVDRVGFGDVLLRSLFYSILDEIRLPGISPKLFLDAVLRTFILKLVRDYSTANVHLSSVHELAPYRLRRVIAYIEAHLAEDISLNDLAAISGYSLYHFSRGFRRATGLPPYRYVVERRIERAKILLQEPFLPLADIARQCGFNSQRQFGTMFTRFEGISPGRFQRER